MPTETHPLLPTISVTVDGRAWSDVDSVDVSYRPGMIVRRPTIAVDGFEERFFVIVPPRPGVPKRLRAFADGRVVYRTRVRTAE
jgi:hypothetical protein